MKRQILFFGLLAFCLLMLFQISSMWLFIHSAAIEWLFILISIISIIIGIYFGRGRRSSTKNILLKKYTEFGITEREYQVLCMISDGHTNKEVGAKLYISDNTVKTHLSNLYAKLNAQRRTQALKNAKDLKIIS